MREASGPLLNPELDRSLRDLLREVPHFPIEGILFKDLAPLLAQRGALTEAVSALEPLIAPLDVEAILAIDARGFILGAAMADRLRAGLVMVRKPGKLPGEVQSFDYTCEYCTGRLEITTGAVTPNLRCLVIDDLLATGGTARATADFIISQRGIVVGFAFMLEIGVLKGRDQLVEAPVISLIRC
ncbi:MAG: adenine phosphoribosyltransferase [Myxacorys californica WJT36-NPBG1]|jgi:adenine phosphoribosyltransferase|nr:adenine phosphoribosyltransferase [Myxacorys californica WJT36-NPBG1]